MILDSENVNALLIDLLISVPLLVGFSSLADILPKLGIGVPSDSALLLLELDCAPNVPLYKLPPMPKKLTVLFEFSFVNVFLEYGYC
jgi:hypothetical protein